jgi:DNA-binding CsgD family transcriptional regulator
MRRRGRPPHPELLTPREQQVLQLIREGLSNEAIGRRLGISRAGVKYHVSEILSKLQVANREEAGLVAVRGGHGRGGVMAFFGGLFGKAAPIGIKAGTVAAVAVAASAAVLFLLGLLSESVPNEADRDLAAGSPRALPDARIFFSAGGSIWSVRPDGTDLIAVVQGQHGDLTDRARQQDWASSPAVSPDGTTLAFVRNYDVWLSEIDGTNQRLLAKTGGWIRTDTGASNPSLGASSVAWNEAGDLVQYIESRIGGSGVTRVWWITADEGATVQVQQSSAFLKAGSSVNGEAVEVLGSAGGFVSDHFMGEKTIYFGQSLQILRPIATGIAAALDGDGEWVAYFRRDELRLVSTDGVVDLLVTDVSDLGGRDRHFAELPDCFPTRHDGCSFRPPVISWGPP